MAFAAGSDTVTIASGASLSDAADLGDNYLVGILMPSAWTAAELTFQGSLDNSTFTNLYWDDVDNTTTGYEVVTTTAAASRLITLDWRKFAAFRYVKVRSGTAGTPVNQAADRVLTLVVRKGP